MSWLITLLRRTILLIAIAALGRVVVSRWRARNEPSTGTPEWPPLDGSAGATTPGGTATSGATSGATAAAGSTASSGSTSGSTVTSGSSGDDASTVTPLVTSADTTPSGNGGATWVEPNDDGTCPVTHPIKANDNSGIFHVPGGQFYDRTGPERCYASAEAALADGYRQAKA